MARLDAAYNYGLTLDSIAEKWGKRGPLAAETRTDVRNKGAEARTRQATRNGAERRSEEDGGDDERTRATNEAGSGTA